MHPSDVKISAVICCYNREQQIARCIEAFKAQSLPKDQFELVLVNDGSTDNTGSVMREALKELNGTYVEHGRNRALAAARNSALGVARGEYIFFSNDDTYPDPNMLEELLKTQEQYKGEKVAVCGYIPFSTPHDKKLFSTVIMNYDLYFGYGRMKEGEKYPFDYFIGSVCLEREAYFKHGIRYHEGFTRYGYEDIEVGYRFFKKGYRVVYNPRARMVHDHDMGIEYYERREMDNAANILQFVELHPELLYYYLGTKQLDQSTIDNWKQFVANTEQQVAVLSQQVREVEDRRLDQMSLEQMLGEVASAIQLIGQHYKIKSYVETLENNPELKAELSKPHGEQYLEELLDDMIARQQG